MGTLSPSHRLDYSMSAPPVDTPPNESWWTPGKIVSLYSWGHLVPQIFANQLRTKKEGGKGLDIRPSTAVTSAHIKLSELDGTARRGEIDVDGNIVTKSRLVKREDESVNKSIDPGWTLLSKTLLRHSLFEETDGMYPKLDPTSKPLFTQSVTCRLRLRSPCCTRLLFIRRTRYSRSPRRIQYDGAGRSGDMIKDGWG
ncbi:hypothetical protein D9758_012504 [Tetrapyrgos nigripes]|uniref:GTP cyclohydrolase N-terminal domain-containing protein n=1 Tax=Tetrapyrgos nigripes TaxID=182062 RepID=A0A8H5LHN3_9AGAR|nr:hypothetical protein D9758_012504 [Tetrapyrgos nigripes]